MTEHKLKPLPHQKHCSSTWGPWPCTCSGTRWTGYGERVGDCAAVWALCEWFRLAGGMVAVPDGFVDAVLEQVRDYGYEKERAASCVYRYEAKQYEEEARNILDTIKALLMLAASRREGGGE